MGVLTDRIDDPFELFNKGVEPPTHLADLILAGCLQARGQIGGEESRAQRAALVAQLANLDIAAAVARIEQADATTRITGAPLLPFLGANLSANRSGTGTRTAATPCVEIAAPTWVSPSR